VILFKNELKSDQGQKIPGGGQRKKTRSKNSTIKPLSTLSVLYMKIQGDHGPPLPLAADIHESDHLICHKIRVIRDQAIDLRQEDKATGLCNEIVISSNYYLLFII